MAFIYGLILLINDRETNDTSEIHPLLMHFSQSW